MVARSACTLALLLAALAPQGRAADKNIKETPPKTEPKSHTILLVTDAATREYLFLRSHLVRRMERGAVDLAIHLQHARGPGIVADVPSERLLKDFPEKLKPLKDRTKLSTEDFDNLDCYNLLVAFDVNLAKLDADVLKNVRKWVEGGGALVFVAGPVNTPTLATATGDGKKKIQPILDVLPVVPGKGDDHAFQEPRPLKFTREADDAPFLRLDKDKPLSGWEKFFGEDPKDETKGERQGFFSVYPVEKVKDKATVLAYFNDPRLPRKKNGGDPYLVTMNVGRGRVVYLGSGETWRLRKVREEYHEKFWTELMKWAVMPPAEKEKPKSEKPKPEPEASSAAQQSHTEGHRLIEATRRMEEKERLTLEQFRIRFKAMEDELLESLGKSEPRNNNTIRR